MEVRRALTAAVLVLAPVALVAVLPALGVSVEFSFVKVRASPQIVGAPAVLFLPFNLSWSPPETNIYVLRESSPSYYHVFSVLPPLVLVFEPYLPPEAVYRVYASVDNPYTAYKVPYTSGVFSAYDDFDVDTGMWVRRNASVGGGSAVLQPGGWVSLSSALPYDLAVLFSIRGGRALKITLPSPGNYTVTLTTANFTDFPAVVDGRDIYFVDELGRPVYYGVLYLDKGAGILIAYVETANTVVYMMYGGHNPYEDYRLFFMG